MRLVHATQKGDQDAYAELVRAFQDISVAYAASILRDYHLGQDAAQEAFVEAFRELPNLREPAAFPAWLRTIVFKHCDRLTRRKQLNIVELDAATEVSSPIPSPQTALELLEIKELVWSAVAGLSEKERQVVMLFYMGEHSVPAIAEFLNVTTNAVKTRLYAARKRLRTIMSEIEDNLNAARPSTTDAFAEKVRRLIQPTELKNSGRLFWSPGIGTDVWEIFCACITGDLAAVKRLVEKDPSLLRCHYEYRTPLSFAVRENQVDVAAYLLEQKGTDPFGVGGDLIEVAQERGYPEMERLLTTRYSENFGASSRGEVIAAAIRERDLARVKALLDESPDLLHAGDKNSGQPIHWAVMTRNIPMIDELLRRGADIDAKRGDGARSIHLTNGDYSYRGWRDVPDDVTTTPPEVYQHLLERGAYVDMGMACAKGDIARVRELLEADPSLANRVSDYGSYYVGCGAPIKNAALGGHIEIVQLLLDHGADPNLPEEGIAPKGHALHSAVCNGHIEIVRLLLEHGAYPSVEIESSADTLSAALGEAGYRTTRNQEMVDLLCSYGAARPVSLLAHCNDLETAAAVFAANPALADDTGAMGSASGHEGFLRLMLRYQPDLPKRRALGGKTREITEMLFRHGMDANHPNWLRITPLHRFAESGDVQNASIFIEHGADVNARDEEMRSTPLGWAARSGKVQMVELLLRAGADPTLPVDLPWATPMALAKRRGHDQIVKILEDYAKTGKLPEHRLEEYETLARDLIEACTSAEDHAVERVVTHFQNRRPLMWDGPSREVLAARLRKAVQDRLGNTSATSGDQIPTQAQAQLLVALSLGFRSWDELAKNAG